MRKDDINPTGSPGDLGTPIYDELAGIRPTQTEDTTPPSTASESPPHEVGELAASAIVLDLFGRLTKLDTGDGWNGGDLVNMLTAWLHEFGIHEDADAASAARALRVPAWLVRSLQTPGPSTPTMVIHLRTKHPQPIASVRLHLRSPIRDLGEHSSAAVFDISGDQMASIVHSTLASGQEQTTSEH